MRFPGFDGEWEEVKLGELLQFQNGINASKERYGRGIKFVNVSDILNNDFLKYENIAGYVDINQALLDKYSVEYGDILFQRSSETREEVGTANVYLDKDNTATFGGFVIRGKKKGGYDPVYFNNLLKSDAARNSITSRSGGSTRYNVSQEVLSTVQLAFPSLVEQQKIGKFLFLIDRRIQTQNKIIEELKVLKTFLSKRIVLNQICFNSNDNISFPEWEFKTLREILDYEQPNKYIVSSTDYHPNFKIPVLTAGKTFILGYTNETDHAFEKANLPVIIFDDFTTASQYVDFQFKIKSSAMKLLKVKNDGHDTRFIYEAMQAINYEVGGHGRHWITIFSNIEIPVPTKEEQIKISSFLSSLSKKIILERDILVKLIDQKKFLLEKLFI